jgi:hypothetical protein
VWFGKELILDEPESHVKIFNVYMRIRVSEVAGQVTTHHNKFLFQNSSVLIKGDTI